MVIKADEVFVQPARASMHDSPIPLEGWHVSIRRNLRVVALLAVPTVLAGGFLTAGPTAASAAAPGAAALPDFTFEKTAVSANGSFNIAVYNSGRYAGKSEWNADPVSGHPGDALRAYDNLRDGWGVEAILQSPSRRASTAGHQAPYWTSWKTRNIAEGKTVKVRICMVKGYNSSCSPYYSGRA